MEETLPESCGDVLMINFSGTTLSVLGYKCPVCQSVIAEKQDIGLRTTSLGYYRIINVGDFNFNLILVAHESFNSRKLKNQRWAEDQWYFAGETSRGGPVSVNELRELYRRGEIRDTTPVWKTEGGLASFLKDSEIYSQVRSKEE